MLDLWKVRLLLDNSGGDWEHGKEGLGVSVDTITRNLLKYRHVLWDWNGTLVDDVDLCARIVGSIMADHKLDPITKEGYRALFRFPVADYYKDIGFGSDQFATVTQAFMMRYHQGVNSLQLFRGVPEMLADLQKAGIQSSILTAAHEKDVLHLLEHFGIRDFFTHVYGLSDHDAVSKVDRGKQLIQRLACPPRDVIMVGDTDHDWEVAQAMGVDILLVADGHQHHDRLENVTPYVLHSRFKTELD